MVSTVHLPLPAVSLTATPRLKPSPAVAVAQQINKASLSEMPVEARDCKRQNTNEGAFLPSDGSAPNSGRLDENQARFRLQPVSSAGMTAPTWPRAGRSAGTPALTRRPPPTSAWSVQTNEFPAQYLKQWLHWKGFAFCQRMVCFSSMGRIRLNSIFKKGSPSLP